MKLVRQISMGIVMTLVATVWVASAMAQQEAVDAAAAVQRDTVDVELPPVVPAPLTDVVLTRSDVQVTVAEGVAEGTMRLWIESETGEMRKVLILPSSIAVTDMTIKKGRDSVQLVRQADGYHLYSVGKGSHELEVRFAAGVDGKDLKKSLRLPQIGATVATMAVTVPGTSLEIAVSPQLPIRCEEKSGQTTVTVFGGQTGELTVEWSPKAPDVELEAKVFAEQNSTAQLALGVMRLYTQVNYSVVQGKVSSLRLRLPEKATLLKVDGQDIRSWDIETQGGDRVLKVELLGPVTDRYALTLALEQAIEQPSMGGATDVAIETPEVLGVSRETGWLAIAADKGLKAEAGQTEGVSQIDVREMPSAVAAEIGQLHLGFKYVKRPIRVVTRLSIVEAKVSGEVFSVVKVSAESIRVTTTVTYQIKEAGVFRFRIRLGPDVRLADLDGLDINTWSLIDQVLSVDLRSKAEKQYTLQLTTEKPLQGERLEIPRLELLDVQRERGYVAIEAVPGTNVKPSLSEGITQINIRDLPESMPDRQAVTLAYRYIRHPYRLQVEISEVQPEIVATTETLIDIESSTIRVDYAVKYDIRKAGVFTLRLNVPQGLQILNLEGAGIDDWKQDKATGTVEVVLLSKTEGAYALRLTAEMRVEATPGKPTDLPNISCMDVRRETGHVAVRPEEGMRLLPSEATMENIREIDVKELPQRLQQGSVSLAYKYFLQPWKAAVQIESVEPYVTAEIFNFISLGEAYLQASATVKYFVQYAGIQAVRVELPPGADNVDITTLDLKSKEKDPDKPSVWTLTFQAKRKGQVRVNISFQIKTDDQAAEKLVYTGVRALDVKHERGYVAVAPRTDLEVNAAEESKGVRPIDEREIPSDYTQGITGSMALSFRYPTAPFELHLAMVHREPAEVLVAVISTCRLSTVITDDGNVVTDAVYSMRNLRKQYLELRLPAGSRIWHAFVDAEKKTPVTSEKEGYTVTMIPIIGHGRNQQEFEVRIRYSYALPALGSVSGVELTVPQAEVPSLRVGWEISLPDDYVIVHNRGTLNRVDRLDEGLLSLSFVPPQRAIVLSGAAEMSADLSRIQEEHNRRVNENVDSGAQAVSGETPAPIQSYSTTWNRATRGAETGISMNRYYFQTLVALGAPPKLNVLCMTSALHSVTRGVVLVVVLAVTVLLWVRGKATATWKFLATICVAALLLAVRTLAGYSFSDYLTDLIWLLSVLAIMLGGWRLLREIGTKLAAWRGEARHTSHMLRPVPVSAGVSPAGHDVHIAPNGGAGGPQAGAGPESTASDEASGEGGEEAR
ncbi:MAG: hypothetical protein JXL80_11560 [Planctomycetes bacterium]|nr:hypothetical protein [Planctomycetota bacterium]